MSQIVQGLLLKLEAQAMMTPTTPIPRDLGSYDYCLYNKNIYLIADFAIIDKATHSQLVDQMMGICVPGNCTQDNITAMQESINSTLAKSTASAPYYVIFFYYEKKFCFEDQFFTWKYVVKQQMKFLVIIANSCWSYLSYWNYY